MAQKKGYSRQDRVREQMMRELSQLLQRGIKDPRAGIITLTDIELSHDYSMAIVYYTVLDDDTREVTQEALQHAKGYLRSELAKRIRLYRTPDLKFKYDTAADHSRNIAQLMAQIAQEKPIADDD